MKPKATRFVSCEAQEHDSEFRLDPLTGRCVLVAEGRGNRPSNVAKREPVAPTNTDVVDDCDPSCAFCPGNERLTTATVSAVVAKDSCSCHASARDYEVATSRGDDALHSRYWLARAIENKYPVFRVSSCSAPRVSCEELRRRFHAGTLPTDKRFFQGFGAIGRHEVIVDVRRHLRGWGETTELEIVLAFQLLQGRLREMRASGRFAYAFFFKNVGAEAGASQVHSHCQLTATPEIPNDVLFQIERVANYERNRKTAGESDSFWDALLRAELDDGKRVVFANDSFVLYCPYASRFPMQMEICPRVDESFEDYEAETLATLADLIRKTILSLQTAYKQRFPVGSPSVDYNVVMTNRPYRVSSELEDAAKIFRPRLTILPSLVKKAGFEYGSGIDINPVSPETAASRLREYFEK